MSLHGTAPRNVFMPENNSIRRGGLARGLRLSLAGARAGGAFAIDGALKKIRGDARDEDTLLDREARRFARQLGELKGSYVKIGQLLACLHHSPRRCMN